MATQVEDPTSSAPFGILLHTPALAGILDSVQHGALRLRDELQLDGIICRLLTSLDTVQSPVNAHATGSFVLSLPGGSTPGGNASLRDISNAAHVNKVAPANINPYKGTAGTADKVLLGQMPHLLLLDAAALLQWTGAECGEGVAPPIGGIGSPYLRPHRRRWSGRARAFRKRCAE
jgi:hypothetical protein